MAVMTLVHFAILSFRGGALYNYYHHYADKAAMFDFVEKLGLTAAPFAEGASKPGGLLEWLGYIVHGTRDNLASSNVADVFNSIINMIGTATTIVVIMLSASFAQRFGKKAVAVAASRSRPQRLRVLSAQTHRHDRHDRTHDHRLDCLCADHPARLGDLCRRGGLFGTENRAPLHRHGFRHDWLCVEGRARARLRRPSSGSWRGSSNTTPNCPPPRMRSPAIAPPRHRGGRLFAICTVLLIGASRSKSPPISPPAAPKSPLPKAAKKQKVSQRAESSETEFTESEPNSLF
jgi:hypothetical protein